MATMKKEHMIALATIASVLIFFAFFQKSASPPVQPTTAPPKGSIHALKPTTKPNSNTNAPPPPQCPECDPDVCIIYIGARLGTKLPK